MFNSPWVAKACDIFSVRYRFRSKKTDDRTSTARMTPHLRTDCVLELQGHISNVHCNRNLVALPCNSDMMNCTGALLVVRLLPDPKTDGVMAHGCQGAIVADSAMGRGPQTHFGGKGGNLQFGS